MGQLKGHRAQQCCRRSPNAWYRISSRWYPAVHPAPTMSPPCSTSSPTGSIRSVVEADDEVAKSFRRGARPSAPVRRPLRGGLLNDAADSARTLRRRVETVLDSPASKQSRSNFLQVFGSYLGATHQRFVADGSGRRTSAQCESTLVRRRRARKCQWTGVTTRHQLLADRHCSSTS